MNMLKDS